MNAPISAEKPLSSPELLEINQESESQKLDCKPLISATIKHILVAKLNEFTGGKFQCLRTWEENSGKALLDNIKKVYGQKLVDTTVNSVTQINPHLEGIENYFKAPVYKTVADITGINQSVDVCRAFANTFCSLLSQGEAGTTQNVDRLLTIAGVAYSENKNIEAIVDKLLETYSKKFFGEMLPELIKTNCGIFAGPVEKLVIGLGAKNIAEKFLKERILEDYSVKNILAKGDIYQKLILKGVNFIVTKNQDESQNVQTPNEQISKLEDLLNDPSLSEGVKKQLQDLKNLYGDSRLTQSVMWMVPWLLERLEKEENIADMSEGQLNKILEELKTETIKKVVGAGVEKLGEGAKTALDATAVSLGTVVGTTYRYVKEGVCWLGSLIGLGSGKTTPEADMAQKETNPQDEVPAESKSTEAPAGVVPDVKVDAGSATAIPAREVSVRESDAPVAVKDAKTEKPESKNAEVLAKEKQLEDSFVKYLQHEDEVPKAESPRAEGPKTVSEQSAASALESKPVEQNDEESTSVMSAVAEAALKTAKVGGKVAWEGTKLLSRGIWGAAKLLGRGVVATYNYATGSSAELEPKQPVEEKIAKVETDGPKGVPESQTVQKSSKNSSLEATAPRT